MLGNTKLRTRLLGGFALVIALSFLLGYGSLKAIATLGASIDEAVDSTAQKLKLAGEMKADFEQMRRDAGRAEISLINSMLKGLNGTTKEESESCQGCHTLDVMQEREANFTVRVKDLQGNITRFRPLLTVESERATLDSVEKGTAEWAELYRDYLHRAKDGHFSSAHDVMLDRIYPLADKLEKAVDQLRVAQEKALQATDDEANRRIRTARAAAWTLLVLCALAGVMVAFIVRGVVRTLVGYAQEMHLVSAQLDQAAAQVADAGQTLAQGSSEQAASIEEASASVLTIDQLAAANAKRTEDMDGATCESAARVGSAREALSRLESSTAAIRKSSDDVAKIVSVIDEIAFQTNILALNAAVEAARAGAAGAGFSVVADEVRQLAHRSSRAAQDTTQLIESSRALSQQGTDALNEVRATFDALMACQQSVGKLLGEIGSAALDQSRGVKEISRGLQEMEQVTQSNAASAEENAAAGQELSAQARTLREVVDRMSEML